MKIQHQTLVNFRREINFGEEQYLVVVENRNDTCFVNVDAMYGNYICEHYHE